MVFITATGAAYIVFGEKLNTYDDSQQHLIEFEEAARKLTEATSGLMLSPPLYKIYPTKPYRVFVKAYKAVMKKGKISHCIAMPVSKVVCVHICMQVTGFRNTSLIR